MTQKILSSLALLGALALSVNAGTLAFDFEDPKGVNNIVFTLDAPLESISGTGNGITGKVHFNPEDPSALTGSIVLDAKSLTVTNPVMKSHMHGAGWLDTDTHDTIAFEAKEVMQVEANGTSMKAHVKGHLTLRGVTKELTVPVTMTYLPGKLGARSNGAMEGDLLVLRSQFVVNRSDFGIKPGQATDKVAEEIVIRMALAGAAPKS
jgi:polyisoprenoid-binding protein YceI